MHEEQLLGRFVKICVRDHCIEIVCNEWIFLFDQREGFFRELDLNTVIGTAPERFCKEERILRIELLRKRITFEKVFVFD